MSIDLINQLIVSALAKKTQRCCLNGKHIISFNWFVQITTLISLLSLTTLFSVDISFQNVCDTTVPSVVGLIKCQEECNCNKGTVANICCEHQFPYSLIPPFSFTLPLSLCLLLSAPSVYPACIGLGSSASRCHCRLARANWLIRAGIGREHRCDLN